MNAYEIAENKGREIFKQFCDQQGYTEKYNLRFTLGRYDVNDAYSDIELFELKVRDDIYKNANTLFLEEKKFNALIELAKREHKIPCYVNIFSDRIIGYNLLKIQSQIPYWKTNVLCNKTTAENNGKIDKAIIELPTDLGLIYYKNKDTGRYYRKYTLF